MMKDNIKYYRLLMFIFLIIIAWLLYTNYNLVADIKLNNSKLENMQKSNLYTSTVQSIKKYGFSDALKLFNNNLNLKILNINNDTLGKGVVKIDAEYTGSINSLSNAIDDIKKMDNFYSIENIKINNLPVDNPIVTFTVNFLRNK